MVNMENYEEYMLLEADGELSEAEQQALHAFIEQHPELKNEMEFFSALKLEPDTSIVYENKEELLKALPGPGKRTISLGSWWTYTAVAACLAMVILLLRKPNTSETTDTIAHTTQPVKVDTKPTAVEELHSTPKDPVAIEKKQELPVKAIVRTKKNTIKVNTIEANKNIPALMPVIEKENIAVVPVQTPPTIKEEPIPEKKIEEFVQVTETENPVKPTPAVQNRNKQTLIAFAPVQEKFEGFSEIKKAVTEKVEKVKNITSRIKDTDIQFRFGNKELTVRL